MKPITNRFILLIAVMLFTGYASMAQKATEQTNSKTQKQLK